ncbi:MAG: hypothetical protein IPK13_05510 [Deltaproteobacteria bacterium]|nr:hypothetical protein [Deltaproteobacteria bacterium]
MKTKDTKPRTLRRASQLVRASIVPTLGLLLAACSGRYESPQAEWSNITPEQRAQIRRTVQFITGGSVLPVQALVVAGVINAEGQRVFADRDAPSIVITERSLDLTSSAVLPELDETGAWDPTGGFTQFFEHAFDANGDETRDEEVHKAVREFEAGGLSRFDYVITTDTPQDFYEVNTQRSRFEVGSDIAYTTRLWHQVTADRRVGNGLVHNQVFTYQDQPTLKIGVRNDGSLESSVLVEDHIRSEEGFDTVAVSSLDVDLSGTYTRYRPVFVEANDRPEADFATDTSSSGGVTTTRTSVTTTSEETSTISGLEETKVTTTTVLSDRKTDDNNGARQISSENVTHTTVVYTYEVDTPTDPGLEEAKERYRNHVITTRATTTVTNTYENNGNFTTRTVVKNERYTDDPVVRNKVEDWMTTESTTVQAFDAGTGETTTTREGTKWLLDRIEIDPDFNAVSWSISGTLDVTDDSSTHFFGDDKEGIETWSVQTRSYDMKYNWGGNGVEVKGDLVNRHSSITPPKGTPHTIDGDWDGTLEVKVGGSEFEVSAEEWLNGVEP